MTEPTRKNTDDAIRATSAFQQLVSESGGSGPGGDVLYAITHLTAVVINKIKSEVHREEGWPIISQAQPRRVDAIQAKHVRAVLVRAVRGY